MVAGKERTVVRSHHRQWQPPPAVRAGGDKDEGIFRVLYNISNDETDMHELSHAGGETPMRVVRAMLPLLPRAFSELCRL